MADPLIRDDRANGRLEAFEEGAPATPPVNLAHTSPSNC